MEKIANTQQLTGTPAPIPGLKPPVWSFAPTAAIDLAEVDAFNRMIRDLRDQQPAGHS